MRRVTIGMLVLAVGLAPAAALAHSKNAAKPVARAHTAQRLACDGVRRDHFFYFPGGVCNSGIGSPGGFTLDYYMFGWGQAPLLRLQLRQRGMPYWAVNQMMRTLHGAAAANNKKAPYDWAKVARRDLIKAAAIKCLFFGSIAAGLNALWDAFGSNKAIIAHTARSGALGCAAKVAGDWGWGRIKQKYRLQA